LRVYIHFSGKNGCGLLIRAGPESGGGGLGVESVWVADAGSEPVYINIYGDPFGYEIVPVIKGGKLPPPNWRRISFASGKEDTDEDIRRIKVYALHSGDKVLSFSQGGAGVGDPLERDIEAVRKDVRNELVSLKSARDDYGVVIHPVIFEVDRPQTEKLRREIKRKQAK